MWDLIVSVPDHCLLILEIDDLLQNYRTRNDIQIIVFFKKFISEGDNLK